MVVGYSCDSFLRPEAAGSWGFVHSFNWNCFFV